MGTAAIEPVPGDDAERSDWEHGARLVGSGPTATTASSMYLIHYNVGTIVLGFAEPRVDLLLAPIFVVGGVLRLIDMSERISPYGRIAAKLLLPLLAAVCTIAACVLGWWPV